MSRFAKRVKLDSSTRSNGPREEIKQPLYSGQFMTSSIDNNPEVYIILFIEHILTLFFHDTL